MPRAFQFAQRGAGELGDLSDGHTAGDWRPAPTCREDAGPPEVNRGVSPAPGRGRAAGQRGRRPSAAANFENNAVCKWIIIGCFLILTVWKLHDLEMFLTR
jgi:hypothetical protein